ncbi:unnamed protein product [Fraxinus pennsylvanica]|uniref:O-methyltransferase dimerisation domain-containing protein n=1 Tax=Fraxinus pennsylvanica TaxID=56036 RepID=A0AAD1ZLL1_9LAMI|nr:unnamed protein product [Fraxinus pennsylvanica]
MEEEDDDEACLFAMLASASVLPMGLKTAIELDLLEIKKKTSPGAFISASELAKQLPTKNPDAASMVVRILRLLAWCSIVNCSVETPADGGGAAVERVRTLAPVCKF